MIRRVGSAARVGSLVLFAFPVWAGQAHIDNPKSAKQFEDALLKDPRSLPALTALAKIRKAEGRNLAAAFYLRQAVDIAPEDLRLQFALADALTEGDRGDEAADLLKRLLESNPNSSLCHFNVGSVYARQKRFEEAAAEFEEAYRLDSSNDDALISAAKARIRLNQFSAAQPLVQVYLGRNQSFDAWYLSGIVQRGLGRYSEAARMLRQAVKLDPNHSDARYNLGFALSRMDDLAEARAELEQAKKLNANSPEIRYQLASVLRGLGEQELSRRELAVFQSLKTKEMAIVEARKANDLGNELLRKGDARAAVEAYRQALTVDSGNAGTYYNLSLALAQGGDFGGELQAIAKAIERDPNFALAHSQLGRIYLQQGRVADAKKEITTALAINPQLSDAQNNLGVLYGQTGKPDEATRYFRLAISNDPAFAQARLNLGLILASRGQLQEAEEEIEAAAALSGGSPQTSAALEMIRKQRNAGKNSAP
jgi:tetratricopeptide (TPR) repeat protein